MPRPSIICALAVSLALSGLPDVVLAHPGRTAGDGCHYCRTNCDSWGEAWNERHCHGGYDESPSYSNTAPAKPSCPSHSTSDGYNCVCDYGYAPFGRSCVKIPANAHAVNSTTDAWECDYGYKEVRGACVRDTPAPTPTTTKMPAPISMPPPVVQEAVAQTSVPSTPSQEDSPGSGLVGAAFIGGGGYWYWKRHQKKALAKKQEHIS